MDDIIIIRNTRVYSIYTHSLPIKTIRFKVLYCKIIGCTIEQWSCL